MKLGFEGLLGLVVHSGTLTEPLPERRNNG